MRSGRTAVTQWSATSRSWTFFFIAADTPVGVLAAYHRLTGSAGERSPWSLGVLGQPRHYRDEADIMATADEVRERRFPADVITFDGRAWQDTPTRFPLQLRPVALSRSGV